MVRRRMNRAAFRCHLIPLSLIFISHMLVGCMAGNIQATVSAPVIGLESDLGGDGVVYLRFAPPPSQSGLQPDFTRIFVTAEFNPEHVLEEMGAHAIPHLCDGGVSGALLLEVISGAPSTQAWQREYELSVLQNRMGLTDAPPMSLWAYACYSRDLLTPSISIAYVNVFLIRPELLGVDIQHEVTLQNPDSIEGGPQFGGEEDVTETRDDNASGFGLVSRFIVTTPLTGYARYLVQAGVCLGGRQTSDGRDLRESLYQLFRTVLPPADLFRCWGFSLSEIQSLPAVAGQYEYVNQQSIDDPSVSNPNPIAYYGSFIDPVTGNSQERLISIRTVPRLTVFSGDVLSDPNLGGGQQPTNVDLQGPFGLGP